MCDYSLEEYLSRDAREGDQLRTQRFKKYNSMGLVDGRICNVAVCLKPGTKLLLSGIPQLFQEQFGVGAVAEAAFEQRELPPNKVGNRDGVLLKNGTFVLFQDMDEGVAVTVLAFPDLAAQKQEASREPVVV